MEPFNQYLKSRYKSIAAKLGIENIDSVAEEMNLDNPEFLFKIQRELLKGKPVSKDKYYDLTGFPRNKADDLLEKFGETDEQGNLLVLRA